MASTQQFIPIEDIRDDLVFLKNGGVSLVISTSAVNFGLLFETEQISIIEAFAGLLNSLSFPIQIVISSKRLDVASYLTVLDEAMKKQVSPLLREMTMKYRGFVESIIKENNVLDKQFYVCINAPAIELGVLPKNAEDRTKKAMTLLMPRRDHLIRQLGRLGLKARQLNTVELVKLFYEIYNPPNGEISPIAKVVKMPNKGRRIKRDLLGEDQPETPMEALGTLPQTQEEAQPASKTTAQSPSNNSLPLNNTTTDTDTNSPFVVEELTDD
jgi:hypothetical protein